nr:hypothetical protein [Enterococcus faecalis]
MNSTIAQTCDEVWAIFFVLRIDVWLGQLAWLSANHLTNGQLGRLLDPQKAGR